MWHRSLNRFGTSLDTNYIAGIRFGHNPGCCELAWSKSESRSCPSGLRSGNFLAWNFLRTGNGLTDAQNICLARSLAILPTEHKAGIRLTLKNNLKLSGRTLFQEIESRPFNHPRGSWTSEASWNNRRTSGSRPRTLSLSICAPLILPRLICLCWWAGGESGSVSFFVYLLHLQPTLLSKELRTVTVIHSSTVILPEATLCEKYIDVIFA